MKKSILVLCTILTTVSLAALSYINWNNALSDREGLTLIDDPDLKLVYNIDSRYLTTISKEDLINAKTIVDILPTKATESIVSYHSTRVSILDDFKETDQRATANNEVLNDIQIKLLQTVDYSTNIYIRSDYRLKNEYTGELENRYLTYFISVIPENEAEFAKGQSELINYLKAGSKEQVANITRDQLKPGRVSFRVTKKGGVKDVRLTSTSGYPSVDDTLIKLISDMPQNWKPATNSNGEQVEQEFIFFFGLQGC